MSYILEALKKAQAERQLGSTPGIHDATVPSAPQRGAALNARLWLALGAALLLVGGGFVAMRTLVRHAPPAPPAVPAPEIAVAPAQSASPVAVVALTPVQQAPAPVKEVAQAQPLAEPAPEPPPAPTPSQAADSVPALASLPPSVAAGIPRVTLGGYIYSPVPSERLVLVDKDLRREGEEVAPGMVLEKLLPDGAVMNYRGTRFRMPY
ncbi:MAG TPA: general secretion pathway protein GspB [Telluria sp.]